MRLAAQSTLSSPARTNDQQDPEAAERQVCGELQLQAPLIIEFRTDASGATEYRELALGAGADENAIRWQIVPDAAADARGWRPAINIARMDFRPPINSWLKPGASSYVAYTVESDDPSDRDEYDDLTAEYGPRFGTFRWKDRIYDYALLPRLPCFPPPA